MTATNPNPLANPLNDRPFGNLSFSQLEAGEYFKPDRNAKLPDSEFDFAAYQAYQDSLHVPETASEIPVAGSATHQQNWQMINGVRTLKLGSEDMEWHDNEIIRMSQTQQNQMSKADIEYNKMLAQKNAELSANMSDYQKELLADVESYIGKSRLVEESLKNKV